MTVELKPFDRNDWHAFSGAEEPSGGEPCLIGYADAADDWPQAQIEGQLVVIVDASGVGIHGLDSWLFKPTGYAAGKIVASELVEPVSLVNLLAAGFDPCNFSNIGREPC